MRKLWIALWCGLFFVGVLTGGCKPATKETPDTESLQPTAPEPSLEQEQPASEAPPTDKAARDVTIYRDQWGVPHIVAGSEADAAFGLGYAQAEDRLDDIYINIRIAVGTMAEAFGPDHVEQDYIMRLIKNAQTCQESWDTLPEHLKSLAEGFVAGVNAYLAEHPEKKPDFAFDIQPWHCAAIGRAMILRWPLGTIMDDLKNKDKAPPFASNGWAVAPARSADGCAILLTDPHLTWEGMAVFYEARVHGGDLHVCGFFLVGSPVMALGHNDYVGWACTTGGPDTSDVYMLKLNPQNPMQYEYDGQWLTAQIEMANIPVKGGDTVQRPMAYTIHGPVIGEPDLKKHIAYAGATPYLDSPNLFEQMYRMNKAKNCDEFYQALAMNEFMEQNVLFADRDGNIQYVRTGRTPIRPKGYNWEAPVPGNVSLTKWLGIHDIADLVQCKNPPQGYFQNCNISPQNMMLDSPMTPDKYPDYIYNVSWDFQNARSLRAVELLAGDDTITKEEAISMALDVHDVWAEEWQSALKTAVEKLGADKMENDAFAAAVKDILAWNGQYTKDSKAALIVKFWRTKAWDAVDAKAINERRPITDDACQKLLDALDSALADMKQQFGDTPPTWGDIHVVGRGGKYFPADGADYGRTETLFDVSFRKTDAAGGKLIANNGSMATILMFFHKDGIESYTCTPWGQSADPDSPHYMDQGEKLYSQRTFKPTWFWKDGPREFTESQRSWNNGQPTS